MSQRSPITTHVLDVSLGKPAAKLLCKLRMLNSENKWEKVAQGMTNQDGRIENLISGALKKGTYRLEFMTGAYFQNRKVDTFYPSVTVIFEVADPKEHYHVPLLLSPYGYSTYRGS